MLVILNSLASRLNWSYIAKDPSTSQYYCKGRAVYSKAVYIQRVLN